MLLSGITGAFPEGAPWGAANPDSAENCSTCHFDDDPVRDSAALSIDGLPGSPMPGESYELTIRFADPDAVIAGFQMLATADDSAGEFHASSEHIEYLGAAIRSTDPSRNEGEVTWQLTWTAPRRAVATVTIFLAVMGSNDDGSPFGDRVHFRAFQVAM
jgi:hypothetical protein